MYRYAYSWHYQKICNYGIDCVTWRCSCILRKWISTSCVVSVQRNDMKWKYIFWWSYCSLALNFRFKLKTIRHVKIESPIPGKMIFILKLVPEEQIGLPSTLLTMHFFMLSFRIPLTFCCNLCVQDHVCSKLQWHFVQMIGRKASAILSTPNCCLLVGGCCVYW